MTRKLASVQEIRALTPIVLDTGEPAGKIELAQVLEWRVVVSKGAFRPGDRCVYFEIDSVLPAQEPYTKIPPLVQAKYKVKTMRLGSKFRTPGTSRPVYSQGLALPPADFPAEPRAALEGKACGEDVTEMLGVQHVDDLADLTSPMGVKIQPGGRPGFPAGIRKTDQDRVQAEPWHLTDAGDYCITEKLDGTSATYVLCGGEFTVASRNMLLPADSPDALTTVYWRVAKAYKIEESLRAVCAARGLAGACVQGEICGPGVQKNRCQLAKQEIFVFNAWAKAGEADPWAELGWDGVQEIAAAAGLRTVPFVGVLSPADFPLSIERAKALASRAAALCPSRRAEGVVLRKLDGSASFKVVSEEYLAGDTAAPGPGAA